jgi:ATP-dependent Lhr-like helicase
MERMKDGKRVPAPLQRMRSEDRLAAAFPQVIACGETLPPGDIPVPYDHPIVRQTVEDCLHEVLDVDGFLAVVRGLHDRTIERVAVDTAEPSAFARSILAIKPYGFLDDAPLEERRTQAVLQRRVLEKEDADAIGALDPDAVAQVRSEAWPTPESAEEVHEALGWMGWLTDEEAAPWRRWLDELAAARRVVHEDGSDAYGGRWLAVDSTRDPTSMLKGRLEALGPIVETRENSAALYTLEQQGVVLRTRVNGKAHWCERRLLARIHRYTLEKLRKEIEPVSAAVFLRFLAKWQHLGAGGEDGDDRDQVDGPQGLLTLVQQLAGFEVPAAAWESQVLPRRMRTGCGRSGASGSTSSRCRARSRGAGCGAAARRRSGRRRSACCRAPSSRSGWSSPRRRPTRRSPAPRAICSPPSTSTARCSRAICRSRRACSSRTSSRACRSSSRAARSRAIPTARCAS